MKPLVKHDKYPSKEQFGSIYKTNLLSNFYLKKPFYRNKNIKNLKIHLKMLTVIFFNIRNLKYMPIHSIEIIY